MSQYIIKFRMNIAKYVSTEPLTSSGGVSNPIERPGVYRHIDISEIYEDVVPPGYMEKYVDEDFDFLIDPKIVGLLEEYKKAGKLISGIIESRKHYLSGSKRDPSEVFTPYFAREKEARLTHAFWMANAVCMNMYTSSVMQYYPRSSMVKIIEV
jgi:hypothetical protein